MNKQSETKWRSASAESSYIERDVRRVFGWAGVVVWWWCESCGNVLPKQVPGVRRTSGLCLIYSLDISGS
jgi:hypothetical protein